MKKLALIFAFLSSMLFANEIYIGQVKDKITFIKDSKSKILFIVNFQKGNAVDMSDETLQKVKNQLVKVFCKAKDTKKLIDQGYKIVVTYIYPNDIVAEAVIDKCVK